MTAERNCATYKALLADGKVLDLAQVPAAIDEGELTLSIDPCDGALAQVGGEVFAVPKGLVRAILRANLNAVKEAAQGQDVV